MYSSAPRLQATSYPLAVCSAPTGVTAAPNSPAVTKLPWYSSNGPVPVSYTHLDVYKRQLFGYELSQYDALFEEKLSQFANLIRHGTVTRRRLHNQRVYPPIESGTLKTWICLLYTSRCV